MTQKVETLLLVGNEDVENTNLESHRSKQSLVQYGYRDDVFLKKFGAPVSGTRSPAVNQGYLARAIAIENSFEKAILKCCQAKIKFQVLSCGAGFDTSFFRLKNAGCFSQANCTYFEVDFPKVAKEKSLSIQKNHMLLELCLTEEQRFIRDSRHNLRIGSYSIIGCDLTDTSELESLLLKFGFDRNIFTIVLCECSLTYIESIKASEFYRWLVLRIPDVHLIVYEQIQPQDRFGRIMYKHFKDRASPLLNVNDFPSLQDQERRLRYLGFAQSQAISLVDIMKQHFGESERERRRILDASFDEFEELFLKCSHYSILEGLSSPRRQTILPSYVRTAVIPVEGVCSSLLTLQAPQVCHRYGHSAFINGEKIFILGGTSSISGRDKTVYVVSKNNLLGLPIKEDISEAAATTFAAACTVSTRNPLTAFVHGGRHSPLDASGKLFKIVFGENVHCDLVCENGPQGRWKHTLNYLSGLHSLVLVGGRHADGVFDDIWSFDLEKGEWTKFGEQIRGGLHSHAVSVWKGSTIIITGGLTSFDEFNTNIFLIDFVKEGKKVTTGVHKLETFIPRFSHKTVIYKDRLYVIGGVLRQSDGGISIVDLKTMTLLNQFNLNFPISVGSYNFALIRIDDSKVWTIGGGGNCFSFGMHIGTSILQLDLGSIPIDFDGK